MFLSSGHGEEHPVVRDIPLASKTNILDIYQCLNRRVHGAGGGQRPPARVVVSRWQSREARARFVGDPEETFERRGSELRAVTNWREGLKKQGTSCVP